MDYCYRFPVVKGVQAGNDYYIGMVPLRMLMRLFPNDEEYVLPEYRAQRKLNESRIPDIKNYILNNKKTYVFSALAASIDGEHSFVSSGDENTGILEVSLDAKLLMNDGQHRKAAIIAALDEAPELGAETISVVFFADQGLKRSQQMFTDLNKHAVKTSNSIAELYDSRDPLAVITRDVVSQIPFLDEYVDKERDMLGKYSSSLFTLNTFYNANKRILSRGKCDSEFAAFLLEFWNGVVVHMVPWNEMIQKEISKIDLREKYVATQAIIIQAFGRVGACLKNRAKVDLCCINKIRNINWKRSSEEWKLRVIQNNGRIMNSETAICLAANYIKQVIGLPLSEEEVVLEEKTKN